jgi:HK97 family phage major capsid protein
MKRRKIKMKFDFSGWATKNDLRCSDGRTIRKNAFKDDDGQIVPLVWQHLHDSPSNVLGHALLQNKDNGVYAFCSFNNSDEANDAKIRVEHGDIASLSIYANQLTQSGSGDVLHGHIREVSLVLAGANPGAMIDCPTLEHGDGADIKEAIIYTGEDLSLEHADDKTDSNSDDKKENKDATDDKKENKDATDAKESKSEEKTIGEIFDTLNDEQKEAVYAVIGMALDEDSEDNKKDDSKKEESNIEHYDIEGGNFEMNHNVFETNGAVEKHDTLTHAEMETIIADGKRFGSLKESVLQHADEYGIKEIEYLFPDAKNLTPTPEFIKRDTDWVAGVMAAVSNTPFSRVKSIFADITEDEARAKGYIKGKKKKDEVFALLKRTTSPTTIYKKQKLDRDDVVDITDFDVVAWLKTEMRMMLDEEIARAILVGDGRNASSDDKISETNIRPIYTDDSLYSVKVPVSVASGATDADKAKAFITAAIKSRKNYKGSGNPTLYTTEDVLTDMLLLEDAMGRRLYNNTTDLATALRVTNIVTVPVMEGLKRTDSEDSKTRPLAGIIVNLKDYNVGADKGGAVNMFDDFDIDYNAQKYLIETRCSGALVKPYSALVLEIEEAAELSEEVV